MNDTPDSVACLDERQKTVRTFFLNQWNIADNIGFRRWLEDSQNRIAEPLRGIFAERTAAMIDDFKGRLTVVADSLPAISTSGDIHADHAPLYLEQELLRENYRDEFLRWLNKYELHRSKIANTMKSEVSSRLPEKHVCSDSVAILGTPLSDLSEDETLRRACLILGRIQKEKSCLRWNFWATPINSIQSTGLTVVSSVVLMGHWLGGAVGIGTTGCHYGYEFFKSRRQKNRLSLPERNCLRTIRSAMDRDRGLIMCYLSEAGIQTDPDSLLEQLKE